MKHLRDEDVISRLASVDPCWFKRIITRRFKNKTWNHLLVIYRSSEETVVTIRNNRTFLESCFQLKGFIKQLKSFDCLTDIQALIINRQKFKIAKSKKQRKHQISDFLHVIRLCDKSTQLSFGRCLLRSGQSDAARVEINGGVVVKARMKYSNASPSKALIEQTEKLGELIKEVRTRFPYVAGEITRLFKSQGVEFLGSPSDDREGVVWIWCQSQAALTYVHNAYTSNRMADVFNTALKNQSSPTDSSLNISIDKDQLEKEIGYTSIMAKALTRHREFLIDHVEPDFGLIDQLNARKALSDEDKIAIQAAKTAEKRNSELIDRIIATRQHEAFVAALQSSNQAHIVKYLKEDGSHDINDDDWPLLVRERSILQGNEELLSDNLDIHGLLPKLHLAGVINGEQNDFIYSKHTPYKWNEALLRILSRRRIRDYKMVVKYLHRSKQHNTAQILGEGGAIFPESWPDAILQHREFLIKNIEPDFGLLQKLYATGILSDKDNAEINEATTVLKRNFKLLERIQVKEVFDKFVEALISTNQAHVATYLQKNGIYDYGDDWPLTEQELSKLLENEKSLIQLLDVEDLLPQMYSAGVINRRQMDFISSKQTLYEKKGALLGILRRRSIGDFKKTIKCLHNSNQSHIAQILEGVGAVAKVHVDLSDDRTVYEIISGFMCLMIYISPAMNPAAFYKDWTMDNGQFGQTRKGE